MMILTHPIESSQKWGLNTVVIEL